MNANDIRNHVAKSCGFTPNKAMTLKDAQEYWRKRDAITATINKAQQGEIPTSFSEWLDSNRDSIDIGGNWTPDRQQANHDQYGKLPF